MGWRPTKGQTDKHGEVIPDRIYNAKDFDRTLVVDERTQVVAETITAYLKRTDPMAKTIVFCNDIDHAERMRRALINLNPEQVKKNEKYVMKITGVDAKTCKLVVLDQSIQSMTKFKQIIGRGTRIDDRYGKLWFTILDFKKATELFADERFDGIPEKVMVTSPDKIIDEDDPEFEDELNDSTNENEDGTHANEPEGEYNPGSETEDEWIDTGGGELGGGETEPFIKYHISGVTVKKLAERVQYYDADGKLVTESFKDYTKKTIQKEFASMDEFVKKWQGSDRKQVIIQELEEQGVIWQALEEDVSRDMDPFDLICHVAFDQPPLTRKERVEIVKKRNYFTKYSQAAQQVLNALLDKYADQGVSEIESIQVLKVTPFDQMGQPKEIVKNAFGNKQAYEQAISELEQLLYY